MPALATPIRHGKTVVTLTPIFDQYLIFQHVVRLRSIIVKHSITIGQSLYSFSRIGLALSFALNLSVAVLHAQSPSRFKSPSASTSSPTIHYDNPPNTVPDSQPSNERFVASTDLVEHAYGSGCTLVLYYKLYGERRLRCRSVIYQCRILVYRSTHEINLAESQEQ